MKFCKDCKHYNNSEDRSLCNGHISLVDGSRLEGFDAREARHSTYSYDCGPDARFFEPKDEGKKHPRIERFYNHVSGRYEERVVKGDSFA